MRNFQVAREAANARDVALRVFLEWEASTSTCEVLLDRVLEEAPLSGRERDLAFELVRGIFRWRGRLDWQLSHLVRRPLAELHPPIFWILRLGLYQLEHLDRVPAHAAVSTSVALAKRYGHEGSAGLVNAVLRAATTKLDTFAEPDASIDPVAHLECRTSHPKWLVERWLRRFGFAKTLKLAARNNDRPGITLRVVGDRISAEDLLADFGARGVEAVPGLFLPELVRLPGGWNARVEELLDEGLVLIQDEAAALVGIVSRPTAGATILDVCAAPGGKALHLASLCPGALVLACDRSRSRLQPLRRICERFEGQKIHLVTADGLAIPTEASFARVLVDAPCTNTGVLSRRPDARWRRNPQDLERLPLLQGKLLDAARSRVAPGGILVYSTCSLEPEENEMVIRAYQERFPSDTLLSASDVLPEELCSGEFLCTNPSDLPVDGTFAAAIRPHGRSFPQILSK